jgi:hypothetical protein
MSNVLAHSPQRAGLPCPRRLGLVVAHSDGDHWVVHALGATHVGERTEKQLISAFVDKIADLNRGGLKRHCTHTSTGLPP